jgi:predicted alpha/beta hydrolase
MFENPPKPGSNVIHGAPCIFAAADGFQLHGYLWKSDAQPHTALLINPATGVAARYYSRYAAYLACAGFWVMTYDYRGIGESSPESLKGFRATKHDWGALDCEAAILFLHKANPKLPMMAVCHSIGGFALGLAPSATKIKRALFVGCQYAYWNDYRLLLRVPMWMNWHIIMPILTRIFGYFPGKALGWLEDLPAGVAMEWATRFHPSFHKRYDGLSHATDPEAGEALEARMAAIKAEILAIADVNDPFATPSATARLLRYFKGSNSEFVRIHRRKSQLPKLGHFGFFHDRFRNTLWPESLAWLQGVGHSWTSTKYHVETKRYPRGL